MGLTLTLRRDEFATLETTDGTVYVRVVEAMSGRSKINFDAPQKVRIVLHRRNRDDAVRRER